MPVKPPTSVPFSFFVSLCRELSVLKPHAAGSTPQRRLESEANSSVIFRKWVNELRRLFGPTPPETATTLFLFLFPEEDTRRKYGMQETALARALIDILGVSGEEGGRGASLKKWAEASSGTTSLGEEVYDLLNISHTEVEESRELYVEDINVTLDNLATLSAYSAPGLRQSNPSSALTRKVILQAAYRGLRPFEAAVLTQIILKDLRPILYPIPKVSTSKCLLDFNSRSLHVLALQEAMRIWDPSCTLTNAYKVRSTIEDSMLLSERQVDPVIPMIGIPIEISKCIKGQGCAASLTALKTAHSIWAETKYDGERMQIHVTLDEEGYSSIKIFSKSKRESTFDRIATHWIITEALGLRHKHPEQVLARARQVPINEICLSSVILEAEMVAYNEELGIDEFWQIRDLVESTAYGVRRIRKSKEKQARFVESVVLINALFSKIDCPFDISAVLRSSPYCHLAIVFFDILFLNGVSLLSEAYCSRRAILETVANTIPMYAFLARRVEIDMVGVKGPQCNVEKLCRIFASCIANGEEGLVLKASHSKYADRHAPWVKLKKDYIPGYGDTVDLVIVGAKWEKERGRTLRVATTTYTTFYIGVICPNATKRPHLEVYFTVSYGLDRKQLEELNFLIKSSENKAYDEKLQRNGLPFTFNLARSLAEPTVVILNPLLVELFGAGFSKSGEMKYYELRFPRISKVYRAKDRDWLDGLNLNELNDIALQANQKDSAVLKNSKTFTQHLSVPESMRVSKRKAIEDLWMQKLVEFDSNKPPKNNRGQVTQSTPTHAKRQRRDENVISLSIAEHSFHSIGTFYSQSTTENYDSLKGPHKILVNHNSTNKTTPQTHRPLWPSLNRDAGPEHCLLIPKQIESINDDTRKPGCHPFARFLSKALILLDCTFASSEYEVTFIEQYIVPNLLHSYNAFLSGCKWRPFTAAQPKCTSFNHGVVFVDIHTSASSGTPSFIRADDRSIEMDRMPVYIFSRECLLKTRLKDGWLDGEMDIKAKSIAVYL